MVRRLLLTAAVAAVAVTAAGAAPTASVRFAVSLSNGAQRDAGTGVLIYGGSVKFVGAVEGLRPGVLLAVATYRAGGSAEQRLVRPAPDGSFSWTDFPIVGTHYELRLYFGDERLFTGEYDVLVRPRLSLRAVAPARVLFEVATHAARPFAGHAVSIERRNGLGEWRRMKIVRLGPGSSARFPLHVPRGHSELRAVLLVTDADAGYVNGVSNRFFFNRG